MTPTIRRVRTEEWRGVRDLRLEALRDPAAAMAFLDTYEHAAGNPETFWRDRAAGAATGDSAAQFIAEDGEWVGTVTVLRREGQGAEDEAGHGVHGHVVGVYVRPSHRGQGLIEELLDAAAEWVRGIGGRALTLDVHVDNHRAQGAYRRAGFSPTGKRTTAQIGEEIEMARSLVLGETRPSGTDAPRRILLVNGPNLNLLGTREPEVYGTATLADVERITADAAGAAGFDVRSIQSNHEGVLIDAIQAARHDCAAIVINPGGLTHTSVALRDALIGVALPFAEVHISDVHARERFRHFSYLEDVATVRVIGEGVDGYVSAVRQLLALIT